MKTHDGLESGKRVFIRTKQYVDGGQDKFQETNAVVPAPQGRGGQAKGD